MNEINNSALVPNSGTSANFGDRAEVKAKVLPCYGLRDDVRKMPSMISDVASYLGLADLGLGVTSYSDASRARAIMCDLLRGSGAFFIADDESRRSGRIWLYRGANRKSKTIRIEVGGSNSGSSVLETQCSQVALGMNLFGILKSFVDGVPVISYLTAEREFITVSNTSTCVKVSAFDMFGIAPIVVKNLCSQIEEIYVRDSGILRTDEDMKPFLTLVDIFAKAVRSQNDNSSEFSNTSSTLLALIIAYIRARSAMINPDTLKSQVVESKSLVNGSPDGLPEVVRSRDDFTNAVRLLCQSTDAKTQLDFISSSPLSFDETVKKFISYESKVQEWVATGSTSAAIFDTLVDIIDQMLLAFTDFQQMANTLDEIIAFSEQRLKKAIWDHKVLDAEYRDDLDMFAVIHGSELTGSTSGRVLVKSETSYQALVEDIAVKDATRFDLKGGRTYTEAIHELMSLFRNYYAPLDSRSECRFIEWYGVRYKGLVYLTYGRMLQRESHDLKFVVLMEDPWIGENQRAIYASDDQLNPIESKSSVRLVENFQSEDRLQTDHFRVNSSTLDNEHGEFAIDYAPGVSEAQKERLRGALLNESARLVFGVTPDKVICVTAYNDVCSVTPGSMCSSGVILGDLRTANLSRMTTFAVGHPAGSLSTGRLFRAVPADVAEMSSLNADERQKVYDDLISNRAVSSDIASNPSLIPSVNRADSLYTPTLNLSKLWGEGCLSPSAKASYEKKFASVVPEALGAARALPQQISVKKKKLQYVITVAFEPSELSRSKLCHLLNVEPGSVFKESTRAYEFSASVVKGMVRVVFKITDVKEAFQLTEELYGRGASSTRSLFKLDVDWRELCGVPAYMGRSAFFLNDQEAAYEVSAKRLTSFDPLDFSTDQGSVSAYNVAARLLARAIQTINAVDKAKSLECFEGLKFKTEEVMKARALRVVKAVLKWAQGDQPDTALARDLYEDNGMTYGEVRTTLEKYESAKESLRSLSLAALGLTLDEKYTAAQGLTYPLWCENDVALCEEAANGGYSVYEFPPSCFARKLVNPKPYTGLNEVISNSGESYSERVSELFNVTLLDAMTTDVSEEDLTTDTKEETII